MRITLRVTLAAACAAGLVAAPAAVGVDTVVRVEGSSATLIPESAIPIEGTGTATVFDKNFASVVVNRGSAFWQLYRATAATGLGLGFEYFPAFTAALVQKIGTDENAGSVGWQYRVNRVSPQVGADAQQLAQGDRVLWYYGGSAGARELEIAPSSDRVAAGASFTVAVTSYAEDGTVAPGAGAQVRYGASAVTADGAGNATLVAQGSGVQNVTATRAGDIRSAARGVCSFTAEAGVCNQPASPAPTPRDTSDNVAPGSRVTTPRLGARAVSVRAIRGTAGPDRSDVASVEVALARRVGTQCRFRTRSGSLTAPRACAKLLFVKAKGVGGDWLLPTGKGLASGTWQVWSRATDGAGNRENRSLSRINTGSFTVGARARR